MQSWSDESDQQVETASPLRWVAARTDAFLASCSSDVITEQPSGLRIDRSDLGQCAQIPQVARSTSIVPCRGLCRRKGRPRRHDQHRLGCVAVALFQISGFRRPHSAVSRGQQLDLDRKATGGAEIRCLGVFDDRKRRIPNQSTVSPRDSALKRSIEFSSQLRAVT